MIFQNTKLNSKKVIVPLFLVLFIFLISINLQFFTSDKNVIENDPLSEINDLKLSGLSGKINIVGEQGWIDFKNAGNCTGSGSYLDPFVIKDLVIDGQGSGSGIKINLSRNYFFRIENCTIFNCSIGIELFSTDNGTLYQNYCSFNNVGIYLHCPTRPTVITYGCFNNTIIENTANSNNYGIRLDWGAFGNLINNTANNNSFGIYHAGFPTIISENTVNYNNVGLTLMGPGSNMGTSRNVAIDNRDYGIEIESFGFNLTGNFMVGSGIGLYPQSIERMSQINIDATNFVNDKPIYYLINKTDIPPQNLENAGQIFLINCTNILVKDIDVSNSSMGVNIYDSNNITVYNAISSNNDYGVLLQNSNNSFIINSTFKYNKFGNFIGGSNNTVEGNYILGDYWRSDGLTFDFYDDYNKIINNEIIGCINGIVFRLSSNNLIYGNIIRDNICGISIRVVSDHNLFYENFFIGNIIHVDEVSTTNKWNNTEIGNYWDNYTGSDNNFDGIGDTPHLIDYSYLIFDYMPIVDNFAPVITINSPNTNQEFATDSPSFNIRVEEKYLDVMWYTLDGGLNNFTITENGTIDQNAWNSLPDGSVNLQFYATDKTGKIGYAEININKNYTAIPGYNLSLLLMSIIFFGLIIVRANHNKVLIRKK